MSKRFVRFHSRASRLDTAFLRRLGRDPPLPTTAPTKASPFPCRCRSLRKPTATRRFAPICKDCFPTTAKPGAPSHDGTASRARIPWRCSSTSASTALAPFSSAHPKTRMPSSATKGSSLSPMRRSRKRLEGIASHREASWTLAERALVARRRPGEDRAPLRRRGVVPMRRIRSDNAYPQAGNPLPATPGA